MSYQIIGDDWTPADLFPTEADAETFADSFRSEIGASTVRDVGPICIECNRQLTEADGRYLCCACCPRMAEIRATEIESANPRANMTVDGGPPNRM